MTQTPTTLTQTMTTDQKAATSKTIARAERHAARKIDTTEAIQMLQEVLQKHHREYFSRLIDSRLFIPREVTPRTVAENAQPGSQSGVQPIDETHQGRTRRISAVKVMKEERAPVPPIHGTGDVAFTTEDKAEAFVQTLERQCSPVHENADVNRIGRVHEGVHSDPTRPQDWTASPTALSSAPQEIRHAYDKHMQRHATLPIPMEASGRGHDPQAGIVRQLTESYSEKYRWKLTTSTLSRTVNSGSAGGTAPPTKCCASGLFLKMHRAGISKAMVRLDS
ncbi:hypothetical protein Trydic_g8419 [Trypoxylus dichotomus]